MKGKILNQMAAVFLGVGYSLQAFAIMRRDDIGGREASVKAAKTIMSSAYCRIRDYEENVLNRKMPTAFDIGYFEDRQND